MTAKRFLNVQEAAAYCRCSVSFLNKRRMEGRTDGPRFYRLSARKVVYAVEDLDAWLASRRPDPSLGR